jgi:predicted  nucleic acid-binding Zn-ribbon protein
MVNQCPNWDDFDSVGLMGLFKRKTSETKRPEVTEASPEAAARQAKWDELEALVSKSSEETADTEPKQPVAPGAFGGHDLRHVETDQYNAELTADIPSGTTPIDVTPEIAPAAAVAATAMMPEPRNAIVEETTEDTFIAPPATPRPDRADIGSMRLDVARIAADIQSGEELYRRAQQRIENLTQFVEKAEVDFSLLGRLEPENRRLKARNRTLESEIDSTVQKISVLQVDLEDHQRRLAEKTRQYETAYGKLTVAQKNLQDFERALDTARQTADKNALQSERLQTSLDVERRENEVLRERVTETVSELDVKQSAFVEAKKVADSLAQDCGDFRHQADTAQKDVTELRKALATAQTQNNAMKAEMMTLHEDIRTFKTQSEFNIISREDEMTSMAGQIDQLKKQLEIKDEIVRNAARDVTELRKIRTAQDLERERLEAQIETQAFQLEQSNAELLQSRQDVSDFDRRYRDVATALNVSQARRTPTEPVAEPDIQPAPRALDELDGLSGEDIQDRVLDYKLGLRGDIA